MQVAPTVEIARRKSRVVKIGNIAIGGNHPIAIQSMTTTFTYDIDATVKQINRMVEAGCEIVRVAVPEEKDAFALGEIKRQCPVPLIADIHFHPRFALIAIEQGVDKIRLNPGNIRDAKKVREIVAAAKDHKIPIRIGVNGGSLDPKLIAKHKGLTPEAMVESALWELNILEELNFQDAIISLKTSDVRLTVASYQLLANKVDYPFHLGITEAGPQYKGTIKSAVGLGAMLWLGLGDTIRVSLTADPVEEVKAGWEILKSMGLRIVGVNIISCPTCGRCEVDLLPLVDKVEKALSHIKEPINVALMGCEVNGPGEARMAEVGIAAGRGVGVILKNGEILRRINEDQFVDQLVSEVDKTLAERKEQAAAEAGNPLPVPAEK